MLHRGTLKSCGSRNKVAHNEKVVGFAIGANFTALQPRSSFQYANDQIHGTRKFQIDYSAKNEPIQRALNTRVVKTFLDLRLQIKISLSPLNWWKKRFSVPDIFLLFMESRHFFTFPLPLPPTDSLVFFSNYYSCTGEIDHCAFDRTISKAVLPWNWNLFKTWP